MVSSASASVYEGPAHLEPQYHGHPWRCHTNVVGIPRVIGCPTAVVLSISPALDYLSVSMIHVRHSLIAESSVLSLLNPDSEWRC